MRLQYIDQWKGILIFLVVLGHFLEIFNYWNNEYYGFVLRTIYAFHMPFFVFLAGIFYKDDKFLVKLLGLLALYLVFEYCYLSLQQKSLNPLKLNLKEFLFPYWLLWFIFANILWIIFVKIFDIIKYGLLLAILMSLLVGFIEIETNLLALSRAILFFPFFYFAYRYKNSIISSSLCNSFYIRIVFIIGLTAYLLLLFLPFDKKVLFGNYAFIAINQTIWFSFIERVLSLVFACSVIFLFFNIGRNMNNDFLNRLGQATLPIYLFHGFIIIVINKILVTSQININGELSFILSILLTITTCYFLSLKSLEYIVRYIYNFPNKIIIFYNQKWIN